MALPIKYLLLFCALLWSHSQIKAQTNQPQTGQEVNITIGDLTAEQVKIEIIKMVQRELKRRGYYSATVNGQENSAYFQKMLARFCEETGVRKEGGMAAIMEALELPFPSMSTGFDKYGKCFMSCMPVQEYQTIERQVLAKPDANLYPNLEPVYEPQEVEVLVREAYTEIIVTPPVFETVQDTILVQEAYTGQASFDTITERIRVSPVTGEWVIKGSDNPCINTRYKEGQTPETCQIVCWNRIRPEYKTVTKKLLKTEPYPSYSRNKAADQYQYLERKVLKEVASLKIINWSAEYRTEERLIVVGYKNNDALIPPTYITVKEQIPVDGFDESKFLSPIWELSICDTKIDGNLVKKLQAALKEKGYYDGPINGIQGGKTNAALRQYKIDGNFPVDASISVLKRLGVYP